MKEIINKPLMEESQSEYNLNRNCKNFHTFFEGIDDIILVSSRQGQIIYTNLAATRRLGYTKEELLGMKVLDLYSRENIVEAAERFNDILEDKLPGCTLPLESKDGNQLSVETNAWFGDWDGTECIFTVSKDISNQKAALDKFHRIFNNNPALMAVNNLPSGEFTEVNEAFLNSLGYTREEIIGKTPMELELFVEKEKQNEVFGLFAKTGKIQEVELQVRKKDGTIIKGQLSGEIIENQGRKSLLSVMLDITQQQKNELNLKEAKAKMEEEKNFFKQMIDAIPDLVFYKDKESKYLGCNKAFAEEFLGIHEKEVIGKTDYELIADKETAKFFMEKDKEAISKGEGISYEVTIEMADNSMRQVEALKTPFYDEQKNIEGVIGVTRDITSRKAMEEKFRFLFENMTNCFALHEVIFDATGEAVDFSFVMVNRAYEIQMHCKSEDLIGKTILEVNPLTDKEMIKKYCEVALTGTPLHLSYFSKTFKRHFNVITYSPQKGMFASIFEDITERKEIEEKISTIRDRLDLATKAAEVGIWEYDIASGILVWDEAMYKLYGIEEKDFPVPYIAWKHGIHPEDFKRASILLNDAVIGKHEFNPEFRVVWPNGEIHHIKANAAVTRDAEGKALKMIGTNWDITEHIKKEEELIRAKKQAEIANIMKSQFLANMSHEIRTPMNGIMGFLDLLEMSNVSAEQREFIREAKSGSEILLHLINDILDFSKIEAGKLTMEAISFNIRTAIEDAVSLLLPKAFEKNIELNVMVKATVPEEVIGDPSRLRQILNNLISNSVKFTENGEVTVSVDCIEENNQMARLTFEIKDTGIGIRKEDMQKLFKAFTQADASTTRNYGGTGLGLVICKELVKMMGGEIKAESIVGEGSSFTFVICLKISKRGDEEKYTFKTLVGQNILIVDDLESNRKIVEAYLKGKGCRIFEAKDGSSAITTILNNSTTQDKISVAIIDYQMPGMSGYELASTLKTISFAKEIKLILLSSGAQKGDAAEAKEIGFVGYLSKPIRRDELLNTIAVVLGLKSKEKTLPIVTKYSVKEAQNVQIPRILLVEDNEMNRKVVITMLRARSFSCDVAINGREAYQAILKKDYDVILMDCQMPVMDGYEATKKIREIENGNKHTTIIALTANAMEGDSKKCLEAGMDYYITKPINFENMFKLIEENTKQSKVSEGTRYRELMVTNLEAFIARTNINRAEATEIFTSYIDFLPRMLEDINVAIGNSEFEKVGELSHQLKGSSGTLGIVSIYDMAVKLQEAATNGNKVECEKIFGEIKGLFN